MSVAQRVAKEVGCQLGHEVGYSVRFDQQHSDRTMVKFMTDGMLINEILGDPLLERCSVVMVDDIHERTLNTDIILGLLKKIRRKRKDLKIVISSATLQAEEMFQFFNEKDFPCHTLYVEGRCFPVDVFYLSSPCKNYVLKAIEIVAQIHVEKGPGDVLVFLTSQEEIEAFIKLFQDTYSHTKKSAKLAFLLLPIYASLPLDQQMAVFSEAPINHRKIVVATNIAESSITIDGIVFVVDGLFHKVKYYDYKRGYETLTVQPISKQQALQRAGRAGRVKKGECYRLCTKQFFEASLFEVTTPEILRCQLMDYIITVKQLGIGDITKFDMITEPRMENLIQALETLNSLNVIDANCNLTEDVGLKVCELPVETRLAVMIVNSFREIYQCSEEVLILAAMLSVQGQLFYTSQSPVSVIKTKKRVGAKEGDHITLINVYLHYVNLGSQQERTRWCAENKLNEKLLQQAQNILKELKQQVQQLKLKVSSAEDDVETILRCILSAFFMNIAQRQLDNSYRNIRNQELLYLQPQSILTVSYPKWVVYQEVVYTQQYYMRQVSEINPEWILEVAGHFYQDVRDQIIQQKHTKEILQAEKKVEVKFKNTEEA